MIDHLHKAVLMVATPTVDPWKTCLRVVNALDAYNQPHRHYHNLDHVDEMCRHVLEHQGFVALGRSSPGKDRALLWAVLYHDVVYDPTAPSGDNEKQSADMMAVDMMETGYEDWVIGDARDMVLETITHKPENPDVATMLLIDADLARFADPWSLFVKNNEDIRKEYAHVSDEDWQAGRAGVLYRYLVRNPMFYLSSSLTPLADANLVAALRELENPSG